jgi:hypothetical protein
MKTELLNRFYDAIKQAEGINSSTKTKRFFPIITQNKRGGNPTEIGLYDGVTKKYSLIDTRSHELEKCVMEVEKMVKKAP